MTMKFRRREKVAIYITREQPEGWELLVFHPQSAPDSDWQIPAGTIEDAEIAKEAAVRETLEESGLSLATVQYVGEEEMRYPERMRVHYTYFYHAHIECQENRWTHCVAGDGQDCGDFFHFAWLPLERITQLERRHHIFLDRLIHRLERSQHYDCRKHG